MLRKQLQKLFKTKIKESGLDNDDAKRLGFKVVNAKEAESLAHNIDARGGFTLPYFDTDGEELEFYRVRYLEPPKGFKTKVKSQKYAQPADTTPMAYFPPMGPQLTWSTIATDVSYPIVMTEGELKAACATKHGVPTIGLGGVYAWRSAKEGWSLLPELEEFIWEGRDVTIIFDSDVMQKEEVAQALNHLCTVLSDRGAVPQTVTLPELDEEGKTGLDDFIVIRGIEALHTEMSKAQRYELASELWEFNAEVAFVEDPVGVVRLGDRQLFDINQAKLIYANRSVTTTDGKKIRTLPLFDTWMAWPQRNTVHGLTFAPGQDVIVEFSESRRLFNTWKGWGSTPKRGVVKPWLDLLNFLFDGDKAKIQWFEKWCAYQIQYPGSKIRAAVLLWGARQGTGKSLVGYTFGRLFHPDCYSEISSVQLQAKYNDWAINKQFVLGDEIAGGDKRVNAEIVKSLITRERIQAEVKYIRNFTVPDCANYIFTSNHSDTFYLESSDRRFFVQEVKASDPLPKSFYASFTRWRDEEGGIQALFYRMLNDIDTSNFDAFTPEVPYDADKASMVHVSKSDLESWIEMLLADPESVFKTGGVANSDLWTTTQLCALYGGRRNLTVQGMGRALRRCGLRPLVNPSYKNRHLFKTRGGLKQLYPIRNAEKWYKSKPEAIVNHYDKHFPFDGKVINEKF